MKAARFESCVLWSGFGMYINDLSRHIEGAELVDAIVYRVVLAVLFALPSYWLFRLLAWLFPEKLVSPPEPPVC